MKGTSIRLHFLRAVAGTTAAHRLLLALFLLVVMAARASGVELPPRLTGPAFAKLTPAELDLLREYAEQHDKLVAYYHHDLRMEGYYKEYSRYQGEPLPPMLRYDSKFILQIKSGGWVKGDFFSRASKEQEFRNPSMLIISPQEFYLLDPDEKTGEMYVTSHGKDPEDGWSMMSWTKHSPWAVDSVPLEWLLLRSRPGYLIQSVKKIVRSGESKLVVEVTLNDRQDPKGWMRYTVVIAIDQGWGLEKISSYNFPSGSDVPDNISEQICSYYPYNGKGPRLKKSMFLGFAALPSGKRELYAFRVCDVDKIEHEEFPPELFDVHKYLKPQAAPAEKESR